MLTPLRQQLRLLYDSLFCKALPSKNTLGLKGDSWTIIEKPLNKNSIVYSGGVGKDISFELDLSKKFGAAIYLYDPSPTGQQTIRGFGSQLPQNIHFFPVGLYKDGNFGFDNPFVMEEGSFVINEVAANTPNSFQCKSIISCMKEHGHQHIDLLKIDIEGSEYTVIEELLANDILVKQICVEFHKFPPFSRAIREKLITKMEKAGYVLFHKKHADFSFINRNFVRL